MFWLKLFEDALGISFSEFGIYPRKISGLKGLFLGPFIHGDWEHLFSNSIPFFLASIALFIFYPSSAIRVYLISFILPGIPVWIFARSSFHIGLSGVNYCLLAFQFLSGLFRRDSPRLASSLLVVFLYGSMVIGLFPIKEGVSFESHISGTIIGLLLAYLFRNTDPRKKYSWEEEEENQLDLSEPD